MERYFILDKFNTWYDWRLILTSKDITPPEPKIYTVDIDGMNGTLDLSEALTGGVVYNDREITASFWTDYGTRKDREKLLRDIRVALHGKKIKIIEPDDPDHYFYGRAVVKSQTNNLAYAEFTIEAVCEPWRYAVNDTERTINVNSNIVTDLVINNQGIKTLLPVITVNGSVDIVYNGVKTLLVTGSYTISDIKLRQGVNIIGISGNGSVTFTYKEADI